MGLVNYRQEELAISREMELEDMSGLSSAETTEWAETASPGIVCTPLRERTRARIRALRMFVWSHLNH